MLSFAQPLFLYTLAGLALPLIAHLVNRSRAQPLRFPSIRFIAPSQVPRDERRWLRDLLLLCLRLLLLAAIIIALAGPRWTPQTDVTVSTGDPLTMIVLDASASMGGWNAWEQAREAIDQELEATTGATGLVIFDSEVLAAVAPGGNARSIRQIAADVTPGQREGNPAPALEAALERLGGEGPRRLVIISDFQDSTWQGARWPAFGEDVELAFVQVGDRALPNAAILEARTFPASDGMVRVLARVRNDAGTAQDITLTLRAAENETTQTLSFAPGQTQSVDFLVDLPESLTGELVLAEDAYALDNTYALSLAPPLPSSVIAILPGMEEPEKLEEVAFVQKALTASAGNQPPAFSVNGAAPGFNLTEVADLVDVLYLPGSLAYLDEDQLATVRNYIENGGIALITPGQVAPRQFRLMREGGLSETAFLGRPGRHGDRREPFRIAPLEEGDELKAVFDGESARDLALTEIYQYVKVRPAEAAEVLLVTEEGDPLLLRETLGQGTLIISAIGLDPRWSDLPLRNAYLPVLREVLLQAIGEDTSLVQLDVGNPLPAELASVAGPDAALLIEEPGVMPLGGKVIQVNVSRDESSGGTVMLSDIRGRLNRPAATDNLIAASSVPPTELWPWLAALAVIFLLLEMILSTPAAPQRKVWHA